MYQKTYLISKPFFFYEVAERNRTSIGEQRHKNEYCAHFGGKSVNQITY